MDHRSFIARQVADYANRTDFEPFSLNLLDGTAVIVSTRQDITFLTEGIYVLESGGTERVFAYSAICSIATIFMMPGAITD